MNEPTAAFVAMCNFFVTAQRIFECPDEDELSEPGWVATIARMPTMSTNQPVPIRAHSCTTAGTVRVDVHSTAISQRPLCGTPFTPTQIHPRRLRRLICTRANHPARITSPDSLRSNNVPHVAATHLRPRTSPLRRLRRPICTRATYPAHRSLRDLLVLNCVGAEVSTSFAPMQYPRRTRFAGICVSPSCFRRNFLRCSFRRRLRRPLRREPLCCARHRKTSPALHCRAETRPPRDWRFRHTS